MQAKILKFIQEYNDAHGQCPSVDKIMIEMGMASSSLVNDYLVQLEQAGYIQQNRFGIKLVEPVLSKEALDNSRKLRVFLSYAKEDFEAVHEIYDLLKKEGWIEPWQDKSELLPGEHWTAAIKRAIDVADAVIIFLSDRSINKEGFVHFEMNYAWDRSLQKPPGTIYRIPIRLDDCKVPGDLYELDARQWGDYFGEEKQETYKKLLKTLQNRFYQKERIEAKEQANVGLPKNTLPKGKVNALSPAQTQDFIIGLSKFIKIESSTDAKVPRPFWIGEYPVANVQYERFFNSADYVSSLYWTEFPKFDENCMQIGDWEQKGFEWLQRELKKLKSTVLKPPLWDDKNFGEVNPDHPIVGISWYEANAYCKWLFQNWSDLPESLANPGLKPSAIRLPLEAEWVIAAGGEMPKGRYPWDEAGIITSSMKEVLRRANTEESVIEHTTPVTAYPLGKSQFGVIDMAGNVSEWQANFYSKNHSKLVVRGGSWNDSHKSSRVSSRYAAPPGYSFYYDIGFRVVAYFSE